MTAKRYRVFKYYDGSGMWGISDDTAEYTVAYFDNHFEAENLCKVLNDLYEETQAQSIVIREYQNRCDNLHEENMMLKQQIGELQYSKKMLRATNKDLELGVHNLRKSFEELDNMRIKHIKFLQKRMKKHGISIYYNDDGDDVE